MSRYDQNRNKKSNNAPFIAAIMVSLLIGISGTYYVLEKSKNLKATEGTVQETSTAKDVVASRQIPQATREQEFPILDKMAHPVGDTAPVGDNGQLSALQSGLPDLLSSDAYLRQALIKLSPGLAEWLSADQLIRRYIGIANDFSQGQRVFKHVSFLRFDQPFAVEQGENGLVIAPKSFKRYDSLAQAIQLINAKAAVSVYQKFRPLMLQVFAEFSYPKDFTLESIIKKALGEIIAAPALEGQIALVRPSMFYKFADPALEALNPVQKQMIRMGSANTRIIQAKCREFLVQLAKSGVR
jgi:Protein of unknown function (DUF3014)